LGVYYGIDINRDIHNNEGRVVTLEYADYYLVNVYTPNSKPDLSRLEYREKWDKDFLLYIQSLSQKRQVILCGDLNVAHNTIDLKNFKTNKGKCGFTEVERHGFQNIIESDNDLVDICRYLHPDVEGLYTWWSPIQKMARINNSGWRIDYFIISRSFIENKKVKHSDILSSVYGSDHCPVLLELES
jgi:exodeoxyribonuclease-3